GEHLAARPVTVHPGEPDERTATDAFGPTRRHARAGGRWARAMGLAAFAAVFALAGGFAARTWVAPSRAPASASLPAAPPACAPARPRGRRRAPAPPRPPAAPAPPPGAPPEEGRPGGGGPPPRRPPPPPPPRGKPPAGRAAPGARRTGVAPAHLGSRLAETTLG